MKRTINVTQDDIDNGRRGSSCNCPVARAIRRDARYGKYIGATPFYVSFAEDGASCSAIERPIPESVRQFVADFDNRRRVSPFSFEIDVPDELLAQGGEV